MDRLPSRTTIEFEQTFKVAKSFRGVQIYFGTQYLIGVGMALLAGLAQTSLSADVAALLGFIVLGGLLGAVFSLLMLLSSVYKCSSALGSMGLLWVLAMFLPCLNLLTLLVINVQAGPAATTTNFFTLASYAQC